MIRLSLRALGMVCALTIAAACSPALAQSDGSEVREADVKEVLSVLRYSWHDYDPCGASRTCASYFEAFGVGLTFNDGTLAPFAHTQRLRASAHECIVNAREALLSGDRALAVQWVMAARMLDPLSRNWLGDHPDAVVEALRRFKASV